MRKKDLGGSEGRAWMRLSGMKKEGKKADGKCIFLHFLLRGQQKPIYAACAHISTSKVLQHGVLAEYIIYTARHVTVPSNTPSHTPWRAQTPGEIQTPGNYPPSDRLLLHYLCTQHHHRERRLDRWVGERGTRRDGWKWREIKAERHRTRGVG